MEWVGAILNALGSIAKGAKSLWTRRRFRARLHVSLGWRRLPLSVPGSPTPRWRVVCLQIIAPKGEEFVVASGAVEVRQPKAKWEVIGELSDFLFLPVEVPPNRTKTVDLSGSRVADRVGSANDPSAPPIELRVRCSDHHGVTVRSDVLGVSPDELRAEDEV